MSFDHYSMTLRSASSKLPFRRLGSDRKAPDGSGMTVMAVFSPPALLRAIERYLTDQSNRSKEDVEQ